MVDRVFTWIWRINGLLILLGFMLGVALIVGLATFEYFRSNSNQTSERAVTKIAADPDGTEKWVLDRARPIGGTDYIYIQLVSENDSVTSDDGKLGMFGSSYERPRKNSKNILFINQSTGEAKWLFDNIKQLISSVNELPSQYAQRNLSETRQPRETVALAYSIYDDDTNNDGVIDTNDDPTFALTNPVGENYQTVLEGYEKILSTKLLEDGTLAITYQAGGNAYIRRYSIDSSKMIEEFQLPVVGE